MSSEARNGSCCFPSCEHLELSFAIFKQFKTFRNFSRKSDDSLRTFITEYERLKSECNSTIYGRITKEQIEVLELLVVCNLDIDDVKSILEVPENTKCQVDYESIKFSILEIAEEMDKLEMKVEDVQEDVKLAKIEIEDIDNENICDEEISQTDEINQDDDDQSDETDGDTKLIKFSKEEKPDIGIIEKDSEIGNSTVPKKTGPTVPRPKPKYKEKRKQCKDCGSFVLRLNAHYRDVHLGIKVPCDVCGKLIIERHLKKHMIIHKTANVKCDECDYVTMSKSRLRMHKTNQHKPKQFACDICGNQFGTNVILQNHISSVHNKITKCLFCDFQTNNTDSMDRHVSFRHKKSANFVCTVCSFETPFLKISDCVPIQ